MVGLSVVMVGTIRHGWTVSCHGWNHPSRLACQSSFVGTIRQGWTVSRALLLDCQLGVMVETIRHGWTVSRHG